MAGLRSAEQNVRRRAPRGASAQAVLVLTAIERRMMQHASRLNRQRRKFVDFVRDNNRCISYDPPSHHSLKMNAQVALLQPPVRSASSDTIALPPVVS